MSLPVFFESPRRSRAVTSAARLYLIKAFLAVCALTLLLALPSHAQYPGYGPPSHVWLLTYQSSGGGSYVSLNSSPEMSRTIPVPWLPTSGSLSILTGGAEVSAQAAGTVTATLTWCPAGGNRVADPPPPLVYLRVTARASESHGGWAGGGLPPIDAGFADNGWGTPNLLPGRVHSDIETHLIQRDGSSGVIVLDPVTLAAACPLTTWLSTGPDWLWTDTIVLSVDVQKDNRAVAIGSPIETSYFQTGDEHGGSPIQVQHQRSPNGDMIVDSAVDWAYPQAGIMAPQWHAYANLTGYSANFHNPDIWSWSDSGESSIIVRSGQKNIYDLILEFGHGYGNVLGASTSVTATVEDDSVVGPGNPDASPGDGATATSTYTIHWHYPYENWQKNGAAFENAPKPWPSTGGQGAGGQVQIPVEPAKIDFSVAGKIGGGIVAVGLTAIAVFELPADPIILCFLSATGYSLSVINSPPPPTSFTKDGTLAHFQDDVTTEVAIASNNTNGIFLPGEARMTPGFARMVADSGDPHEYFIGGGTGSTLVPQGTLSFDVTAYRRQWQQNYVGDAYDVHGYTGQADSWIKWPGNWEYVYKWTWTGSGTPGG